MCLKIIAVNADTLIFTVYRHCSLTYTRCIILYAVGSGYSSTPIDSHKKQWYWGCIYAMCGLGGWPPPPLWTTKANIDALLLRAGLQTYGLPEFIASRKQTWQHEKQPCNLGMRLHETLVSKVCWYSCKQFKLSTSSYGI